MKDQIKAERDRAVAIDQQYINYDPIENVHFEIGESSDQPADD